MADRHSRLVATSGLVIGALLGMVGTFAPSLRCVGSFAALTESLSLSQPPYSQFITSAKGTTSSQQGFSSSSSPKR
jgi:hypothetical protein